MAHIQKEYWDLLDFLNVLHDSDEGIGRQKDNLVKHFRSDNVVASIRSREGMLNPNTLDRRIERYKSKLRDLDIDVDYRGISGYAFNYKEARSKLDWHFGVMSSYTSERLERLHDKIRDINAENFSGCVSKYNFGFIVKYLFEKGIGLEKFVSVRDIVRESEDGLLESAGLEKFVSMFRNPKKLLFIAYPNLFERTQNVPGVRVDRSINQEFNVSVTKTCGCQYCLDYEYGFKLCLLEPKRILSIGKFINIG